jgi:ribosomal protein L7Ae-like RNA K-turn-binding protein
MFRPTKRQRLEAPPSWLDNEALNSVASPFAAQPTLKTAIVSQFTKELFLERFQKEIRDRFCFSLSSQLLVDPGSNRPLYDIELWRGILKGRIAFGDNAVTRILEAASYQETQAPQLIVMATDLQPPTQLAHIPILCRQLATCRHVHIPLMLLPGPSSLELGKLLGTRRVSVLAFMPRYKGNDSMDLEERRDHADAYVHDAVDSFVAFICSKKAP